MQVSPIAPASGPVRQAAPPPPPPKPAPPIDHAQPEAKPPEFRSPDSPGQIVDVAV